METYTFDVLPPELRGRDLVESLTKEYEWLEARFASASQQTIRVNSR
jgi:hypothetical protein